MDRIEAIEAILKFARKQWDTHMSKGSLDNEPAAFTIAETMIAEARDADADPAAKTKLALEVAAPAHVEGVLALATNHVSEDTADQLSDGISGVISYPHDEYGWLIYVAYEKEGWSELYAKAYGGGVPTDLFGVMDYARRHGCVWLLLDRDAAPIDGLLTYVW